MCHCKTMSWGMLVLRLVVGGIFIYHGYGKLFATPGLEGFAGFLGSLSVPAAGVFTWMVALNEFVGGIAILLGVFTRIFGTTLAAQMLVAYFLMRGNSLQADEFHILLVAASLAITLVGPGRFSLNKYMGKKNSKGAMPTGPADDIATGRAYTSPLSNPNLYKPIQKHTAQ